MPNWRTQFRRDLWPEIQAAWPDVTSIWLVKQMRQRNWVNLVEKGVEGKSGGIVPPWAVVVLPPAEVASDWGIANTVFRPQVTIYYLNRIQGDEYEEMEEEKTAAMRDQIETSFRKLYTIPPDGRVEDLSTENEAMQIFQEVAAPFSACGITFSPLAGYIRDGQTPPFAFHFP